MILEYQKREILALIDEEAKVLGSYNRVATKIGVSGATMSKNLRRPDNWGVVSDAMWGAIGRILGYKFQNQGWQIAETENFKIMRQVLKVAQEKAMFLAVSEKAGSGKTASIRKYKADDTTQAVYVMQCEEWSRRVFLLNLAQTCGIDLRSSGYLNMDTLGERIIGALKQKAISAHPLLILDEADKLKPSALRWLIHLYNKLEDEVGVVIAGTENLKKEIERGVQKALKGYDELDSRFGRSFVRLVGCTRADATEVARANGLFDDEIIERVWRNCKPVEVVQNGKYVHVLEDMRVLKRKIIAATELSNLN